LKIAKILGITLSLIMIAGCGHESDSETYRSSDIYLNHYKSECSSFELALCVQSRVDDSDDWSFFYDHIEGFEYEWGYTYKLSVKIEDVDNPPEDSSSLKYTLLEIKEKIKEPTTSLFDVSVSRSAGLLVNESENIYKIYNDKEIECLNSDCETIDSLIAQDMAILFEFKHQADIEDPLELTQIKCSASRESFRESCL